MTNNEQQAELIKELNDQSRSVERLLEIAILGLSEMRILNENENRNRENIIAFLTGAMAIVGNAKENTEAMLQVLR
ncbi:MAG: hypothetical protein SOR80_05735 [Enterococcus cecorum]|uniref:hypothetical protein n=1 Tax=Enterococcus cecorum TaxID=44008 RepID=UPI0022D37295|nr:hypothetical protein [Enterococcus cecorum]CAI3419124.1 hypothetical protein CIRMBP1204_01744 [Enterococcus cecorum]